MSAPQNPSPCTPSEPHARSKYDIDLPQSIVESFARFLVPEIRKFYETEQGWQALAEWQAEQERKKAGEA